MFPVPKQSAEEPNPPLRSLVPGAQVADIDLTNAKDVASVIDKLVRSGTTPQTYKWFLHSMLYMLFIPSEEVGVFFLLFLRV